MTDEKEVEEPSTISGSKRMSVNDNHDVVDKEDTAANVPKKAKVVALTPATAETTSSTFQGILPMTPKSNFSLSGGGNCVLYMAIVERADSGFTRGLQRLAKICPPDVQRHCFQMDQTRHITMWQGRLSDEQIRGLSFRGEDGLPNGYFHPLPINLTGWKPWKAGGYLAVHPSCVRQLVALVDRIDGLPAGKRSCDHLSLYRKRDYPGWPPFAKLRTSTVGHQWGTVSGVSIRLKFFGTPYDECIIVAQAME
jgi:hypothetical protein